MVVGTGVETVGEGVTTAAGAGVSPPLLPPLLAGVGLTLVSVVGSGVTLLVGCPVMDIVGTGVVGTGVVGTGVVAVVGTGVETVGEGVTAAAGAGVSPPLLPLLAGVGLT